MSTLPRLSDADLVVSRRTVLNSFFTSISRRHGAGAPYDSALLVPPGEIVTDDDRVRELLRKHLPRDLAWGKEEREARATSDRRYDRGLLPHRYSPCVDRCAFPRLHRWR